MAEQQGAHAPAAIHGGGSYADDPHAAAKCVAQAVAAHVVARANGGSGHCGHGGDRGGRGVTFTEALVAGPHHYVRVMKKIRGLCGTGSLRAAILNKNARKLSPSRPNCRAPPPDVLLN